MMSHFLVYPNLKKIISPSSTIYSFPCILYFPSAFTLASLHPNLIKSSYFMTSAQINPFSKSVWIIPMIKTFYINYYSNILPAAFGALVLDLIILKIIIYNKIKIIIFTNI